MSRYRAVHTLIWYDEKFSRLSDDAKLVFFFLLSNPRGTMLGIAVQGQSDMAEFLGWTMKRFREPFAELLRERLIDYHENSRTVYLPKYLKYNPIENENQAKAAAKCVEEIPEICPYLQELQRFLEPLGKPFLEPLLKRLRQRFPKQGSVSVEVSVSVEGEQKPTTLSGSRPTDAAAFISYAFETFQARYGDKLLVQGAKDTQLVKKLLSTYGPERCRQLWDAFLVADDPFVVKAGRSIGVFYSQANKLVSGEHNGTPEPKALAGLRRIMEGRS